MVDEALNITGIMDWQMARVVPRSEAFGPSLVTAAMCALCHGKVSLSGNDLTLAEVLREKGAHDLAELTAADEKAGRFFWGLPNESEWKYAMPLAKAILTAFGEGEVIDWPRWKKEALEKCKTDARLSRLVAQPGTQHGTEDAREATGQFAM